MIVIMKPDATETQISEVVKELKSCGMQVQINNGVECTVLGVLGDTTIIDQDHLSMKEGIDRIVRVQEPFKKANRKFHPDNTVIKVGDLEFGADKLAIIAGPCSVESPEQLTEIARRVKKSGANGLRGGAYKPRSSPYAFQGLGKEGIQMLTQAREATGLPIVSEVTAPRHVEMFEMLVDIIQIGARNMQNFELLKEVGRTSKPVLLKRGLSSTIEELLMSAEYIMSMGNPNVILCERGIRTFETFTRNTLDLSMVPAIKQLSHLPVIIDPSHSSGKSWMVESLSMAAIACGADGLIIEVHNDPPHAKCDGPQSITPDQFDAMMEKFRALVPVVGRTL